MHLLSEKISRYWVKQNIITENSINIYIYGLEVLFSSMGTSIVLLTLSYYIDSLLFGILYLLCSIPLRMTVGGYHALTYRKCFFTSILTYVIVTYISKLSISCQTQTFVTMLFLLICDLYIFLKAPVQNNHHPISQRIYKRNRTLALFFLGLYNFIIIILLILNPANRYSNFLTYTIVSVAILIIPTQRSFLYNSNIRNSEKEGWEKNTSV